MLCADPFKYNTSSNTGWRYSSTHSKPRQ